MADAMQTSPQPRRRRGLRVLGWIAGAVIVLMVAAYLVGTSSAFFKKVILPRVGAALDAEITVRDASIRPFSSVLLLDLKVQPTGRETLLTAAEVRARYSLFDILRGNLLIEEITITSPVITVVQQPDGASNLDPVLRAMETDSEEPTRIDLRKFVLSNATLRREKLHAGGNRDVAQATNVNLTLTGLKNGDSGKVTFSGGITVDQNPPAPGSSGVLHATLNGEYIFALSSELMPLSVKGEGRVAIARAEGAYAEMADVSVDLVSDVGPTEIRQLALQFLKNDSPLAELRASGPLDLQKMEGRVTVQLMSLDRRVLNLVGAGSGLDFGTTAITSSNTIELAQAGNRVTATGVFSASRLQMIRTNQSTPTLDFRADYDLTVDLAQSNVVVRALNLDGEQNGSPLLRGRLTSPMTIPLAAPGGDAAGAIGDSSFDLAVTNLNLGDWQAFLGGALARGGVNSTVKMRSEQAGRMLAVEFDSRLVDVAPVLGDKRLATASVLGQISLQLNSSTNVAVRGGVRFTNVSVIDPQQVIPATPLSAGVELDASFISDVLEVRRLQLALEPTDRAPNELLLNGRVDLSDTNAIRGQLELAAEALDVTRYYDLFAAQGQATPAGATPAEPTATPPSSAPGPEQEGAAVELPVRDFTVNARIGRVYLRELEITNLRTTLKVDGGRVTLKPFELVLNGAPVTATVDLDLSVPGYRYDVDFRARDVPFAPVVNTFAAEHKGELGGTLTALAKIQGTGTTGASLQKSLRGQFDVGTTNLNLDPAKIRQPMLKLLVSVVSMLPQLVQNPEGALGMVGNLASSFLPSSRAAAGGNDLLQSPIDVISARGTAGDGRIELEQATVRSPVFQANARGTITLAPVLTNSTIEIPVSIALSRAIAERIKLVTADTPTNAAYVALPDFFAETGTIGEPKSRINKTVLASATLKQLGVNIPGAGGGTNLGGLLQGIGGILGNRQGSATNPPPAATTNQSPVGNILNQLLGPK